MGLGALFTIADLIKSNLKEKQLAKLLRDRGVDEHTITQAEYAVSYLSLNEKERSNIYKKNPDLDRKDLEKKMGAVLFFIFQYLEVAELVIGNKERAMQAHNEAKAIFARIEEKKNEKVLSLSQVEARVLRFSILNSVNQLTMSEEEKKELNEVADFIKIKTDPIASQGDISLSLSNDLLSSLVPLLYIFRSDSENAFVYGSIGADNFIGETGVRLSEMAPYISVMEGISDKISKQVE